MTDTDISPTVNVEAIREWVAALRVGGYTQGNSYLKLYSVTDEINKYCCLGVACELFAERAGVIRGAEGDFDTSTQYMSNTMIAFLGVEGSGEGDYDGGKLGWQGVTVHIPPGLREEYLANEDDCEPDSVITADLIYLNDELKWDFNKIADCIEYTYLPSIQVVLI